MTSPFRVEKHEAVDAAAKVFLFQEEADRLRSDGDGVKIGHSLAVENRQSQQLRALRCLASCTDRDFNAVGFGNDAQREILRGFGKGDALLRFILPDEGIGIPHSGREQKTASSPALGLCLGKAVTVLIKDSDGFLARSSASVGQFKGDLLLGVTDSRTSLGIESEAELFLVAQEIGARLGERDLVVGRRLRNGKALDALPRIRSVRLHRIVGSEDGQHTREARRRTPIGHGTSVGAHFIVAASDGKRKRERPVGLSQRIDGKHLPFDQLTVGIEQFDVEHTAQRGRSEGGGSHDVCLIVNGVVLHVGGVVEMDIDRLAGIASVKTRSGFETTEQTVRSGELREGRHGCEQPTDKGGQAKEGTKHEKTSFE